MSIDMSQFYEVFFEECAELLAEMERLLLEVDISAPSKDDLNAIFRTAHSIKGGAGTFGFGEITETTHILESLLDKLRNGELALRAEMIDVFLKSVDVLTMQLAGRQSNAEVDVQAVAEIRARLSEIAESKAESQPDATQPTVSNAQSPAPVISVVPAQAGTQTAGALDTGLLRCDEGVAGPVDPSLENLYAILTGTPVTSAQAGAYGLFAETPTQAPAPETGDRRRADDAAKRRVTDRGEVAEASSIRVGVEKVDQLINLVGELVITQAMLAQSVSRVDPALSEALTGGLVTLERNTRDLQESVMSIRMMPISFVFSRFPRVVRDLAAKLNKQVELKTVGEGTELDKGLIEKIADPLNHLVRNSLDHGVETPAQRVAAGKDPKGTITLRAFHQGGSIAIDVADDGGGLNRVKILAKARERGLPVTDEMSDGEVFQLIFEPGFSTAAVVTDVSGRGVGMDVVRRNIRGMGGSVDISSRLGAGTTISIRLPLTLAILDGMSVGVGGETFIIPLTYIIESLQPRQGEIKTIAGQGRVLHVRGEYLPVVVLHDKLKFTRNLVDIDHGIMVILEYEGSKVALLVDALIGQHQVVIKSLETNYRKARGVSGATIMGDGRVALILDVAALVRLADQPLLLAA